MANSGNVWRRRIVDLLPIEEIRLMSTARALEQALEQALERALKKHVAHERRALTQSILDNWTAVHEHMVLTWLRDALRGHD